MSDTTTPRAHHPAKCPKCAHPVLIYSDATTLILSVRQHRAHVSYRDRMTDPHPRSTRDRRGIGTFIRRITGIVMAARECGNGC